MSDGHIYDNQGKLVLHKGIKKKSK